jgi:elongation factor 1-gamma
LTVADIAVACTFIPLYQRVLEPRWRAPFANVNRWFETITQKEKFTAVWNVDPSSWCVVAQKAQKKEEPKKEEPKQEEKKETKKEEKKPEAKKEKAKKKDDEEEEDEETHDEPKAKNPLDLLPKSNFILDDFKRTFSNNPVPVTIEYLNKNFDPAGWSMWFADYKYNAELTKVFMTANLVQGFFNRMDRMRKYAFGIMSITGEDKEQNLSGFWIIRSNEIPQVMRDECDDVDLYTWTKIDFPPTGATLNKVIAYLSKDTIDGKEYQDGKCFK